MRLFIAVLWLAALGIYARLGVDFVCTLREHSECLIPMLTKLEAYIHFFVVIVCISILHIVEAFIDEWRRNS